MYFYIGGIKCKQIRRFSILAFSGQTHYQEAVIDDNPTRGVSPHSVLHTACFPFRLPMWASSVFAVKKKQV